MVHKRAVSSGEGGSFSSYHFLSCYRYCFGVFNPSRLIVNKCSLWFWRRAFIQLQKRGKEAKSQKQHVETWTVFIRIRNLEDWRDPQRSSGPELEEFTHFCDGTSSEVHTRHSGYAGKERPQWCLGGVGGLSRGMDGPAKLYQVRRGLPCIKARNGVPRKENSFQVLGDVSEADTFGKVQCEGR